jgi:hypothetical protein
MVIQTTEVPMQVREVADLVQGAGYSWLPAGMREPAVLRQGHNPKPSKSQQKLQAAMREVFTNPPSTLGEDQTPDERRKQQIAIAFSKARKAGAKLPKRARK